MYNYRKDAIQDACEVSNLITVKLVIYNLEQNHFTKWGKKRKVIKSSSVSGNFKSIKSDHKVQ